MADSSTRVFTDARKRWSQLLMQSLEVWAHLFIHMLFITNDSCMYVGIYLFTVRLFVWWLVIYFHIFCMFIWILQKTFVLMWVFFKFDSFSFMGFTLDSIWFIFKCKRFTNFQMQFDFMCFIILFFSNVIYSFSHHSHIIWFILKCSQFFKNIIYLFYVFYLFIMSCALFPYFLSRFSAEFIIFNFYLSPYCLK